MRLVDWIQDAPPRRAACDDLEPEPIGDRLGQSFPQTSFYGARALGTDSILEIAPARVVEIGMAHQADSADRSLAGLVACLDQARKLIDLRQFGRRNRLAIAGETCDRPAARCVAFRPFGFGQSLFQQRHHGTVSMSFMTPFSTDA